jgi:hypothetical protein
MDRKAQRPQLVLERVDLLRHKQRCLQLADDESAQEQLPLLGTEIEAALKKQLFEEPCLTDGLTELQENADLGDPLGLALSETGHAAKSRTSIAPARLAGFDALVAVPRYPRPGRNFWPNFCPS